jgi:serine/threonine-protein kinase
MNPAPGSCVICLQPLAAGSVDRVCPGCERTRRLPDVAGDTVRPAGTVGPVAHVRHSAAPVGTPVDVPLPPAPPKLTLVCRLGAGGMGAVYQAVDAETQRVVAVKLLHAPGDRDARDRFQVEVRALAELDHPHIVTVFFADLQYPTPYYTMEFVPGGTLARFVTTHGVLAPYAAAKLVATTARAAHAAHARGIVHRDIKPGNVLLAGLSEGTTPAALVSDFVPKLSDFGLVKRTDRNDGLTVGSGAVGTPGFMSPEQAAGGEVSARTDVYGLGATLYHALTGRAPFEDENLRTVIALVQCREPVRVRAVRPEVPVELEAIVHKCLEKNPSVRYASAADLADDLGRFVRGEPVRAKPLTPVRRALRAVGRRRRAVVRAAGAALALAAALMIGAATNDRGARVASAERPAPTPLDEMRAALKAGREVTLIGATGEPRWHKWIEGACGFAPAPERQEACAFQALDLSLLELCPDPLTDHYRIRAELCQLDVPGRAPGGELPTGGDFDIGLYFGRQTTTGNGPWRSQIAFLIRFTEAPHIGGSTRSSVGLQRVSVLHSEKAPNLDRSGMYSRPFEQSKLLPGAWRVIEIEVAPDRVKAWWGERDGPPALFADVPIDLVHRTYAKRLPDLDKFAPDHGLVFPKWTPRAPLGIWSFRSAVAVRNVALTPLK